MRNRPGFSLSSYEASAFTRGRADARPARGMSVDAPALRICGRDDRKRLDRRQRRRRRSPKRRHRCRKTRNTPWCRAAGELSELCEQFAVARFSSVRIIFVPPRCLSRLARRLGKHELLLRFLGVRLSYAEMVMIEDA